MFFFFGQCHITATICTTLPTVSNRTHIKKGLKQKPRASNRSKLGESLTAVSRNGGRDYRTMCIRIPPTNRSSFASRSATVRRTETCPHSRFHSTEANTPGHSCRLRAALTPFIAWGLKEWRTTNLHAVNRIFRLSGFEKSARGWPVEPAGI